MQKNKKIKWGILGLGKIAHKFAEDLLLIDDAELHAVASRSDEKSRAFAQNFGATIHYASYEDLVKDNAIDAIYIATPHSFHAAHSILCLEHKKAVLCEKPFAMNWQEVSKMIAVAKENDTLLMEALWTYFLPHYQYVLKVIQSKSLGELTKLEADFGFKPAFDANSRLFATKLGGGSLLDIGIYPIFAALSTLGAPNTMNAKATFFETGADSTCQMTFTYDTVEAHLKSTFLEETQTEAIFTFTKGVLKINKRFHEPSSVSIFKNDKEETILFETKGNGYYYEILHFNQLLREGKRESNLMTFDFSELLIKTLDSVRSSIGLEY